MVAMLSCETIGQTIIPIRGRRGIIHLDHRLFNTRPPVPEMLAPRLGIEITGLRRVSPAPLERGVLRAFLKASAASSRPRGHSCRPQNAMERLVEKPYPSSKSVGHPDNPRTASWCPPGLLWYPPLHESANPIPAELNVHMAAQQCVTAGALPL